MDLAIDLSSPAIARVFPARGVDLAEVARELGGHALVQADASAHVSLLRDTVFEEVCFGLEQRGTPRGEMTRRATRMIEQVALSHLCEADPARLSGGETKRLALACVAVLNPTVLVVDDPFAGLDPESVENVKRLLQTFPGKVITCESVPMSGFDVRELYLATGEELLRIPALPSRPEKLPDKVQPGELLLDEEIIGLRPAPRRRWWQARAPQQEEFRTASVRLRVRAGEVLWLRGPNGVGKTTVLRTLAGLNQQKLDGHFRSVAMTTQRCRDQIIDSEVGKMLVDAEHLELLGVDPGTHPLDLARGRMRLAQVAQALEQDCGVVAFDEPDVDLSFADRSDFHTIFARSLSRGKAAVITCHDPTFMDEVARYATVSEAFLST